MRALAISAGLLATACGSGGGAPPLCETKTSLVDHMAWQQVPEATDPFKPPGGGADAGPGGSGRCEGPLYVHYEDFGGDPSFTITTQRCHWATVEQPSLIDVPAGDPIDLRVWYFSQTTFDETSAVVLLAFGDEPFWSETVPLPTREGGLLFKTVAAPHDIRAGEMIRWNLSNHGSNTWNLLEVSTRSLAPCPR